MDTRRTLALLLALAAPAAFAAPVWSSDFETGDLSQWTKLQAVSADRAVVVPAPGGRTGKALKVTVNKGDDPINSGNDRAELVQMTLEATGSEYFYKWSTMFPEGYPSSEKWQLFTQWHQEGLGGTPPMELYVVGEEMRLRPGGHEGPVLWTAPLNRGQWHDFILRVKWSADPKVGFVELYHNGQLALQKTNAPTQLPGQKNYLKMGLYRHKDIAQQGVIYFDDVVMATGLEDVLPAEEELVTQPSGGLGSAAQNPEADPQGPSDYDYGEEVSPDQIAGCGASATGGLAPVAGVALVLMGVAAVRRRKAARVGARG